MKNSHAISLKMATLASLSCVFIIGWNPDKHNRSELTGKTISIEIPELKNDNFQYKISEVFDLTDHIKLETNPDLIISGEIIPKIREYKNQIYLLDLNPKPGLNVGVGIYKFNKNGTFLGKIGRSGKGLGEYLYAEDFDILENELFISDISANKIIFHSLKGPFIKEIKPEFRFTRFNKLDANSYFFWLNNYNKQVTSEDNQVIMCDSMFQKITGLVKEDQKKANIISIKSFSVFNSSLYFKGYCDEKIYCFDKNGNKSEFCNIKFNIKNKIPEELIQEDAFKIEEQIRDHNYATIFQYVILKDYLYFEIKAREWYHLLYSVKSGKAKLINASNIINDVNETGSKINISGSVYESNTLIGYVCAYDVIENLQNSDTKITTLSENMKEEDNPVIVYYKIVDF